MYAILSSQGEMTLREVVKECHDDKFAPIVVIKNGENTVIPLFNSDSVLRRFVERNLPKDWIFGSVSLTIRDLHWMEAKSWKFHVFEHPRKLKDIADFDVGILEYEEAPSVLKESKSSF